MHFWIDKRSQPCIGRTFGPCIGRNRVLTGTGFGFAQQRRLRNKGGISLCADQRPQFRPPTAAVPAAQQSTSQQQQSLPYHKTTHGHHHQHSRSTAQSSSNGTEPSSHQSTSPVPLMHAQGAPADLTGSYCNFFVPLNTVYRLPAASEPSNSQPVSIEEFDGRPISSIQQQFQQQPQDNQVTAHHVTLVTQADAVSSENVRIAHDAQLLPAHLKCGMWASLALASVLVAGAKFYFDHQGTGLEVLIFCAFSATFFIFACTVSLCRRNKEQHLLQTGAVAMDAEMNDGSYVSQVSFAPISRFSAPNCVPFQHNAGYQQRNSTTQQPVHRHDSFGSPPPYHKAILLPEVAVKQKSHLHFEETPPPSYDKIII